MSLCKQSITAMSVTIFSLIGRVVFTKSKNTNAEIVPSFICKEPSERRVEVLPCRGRGSLASESGLVAGLRSRKSRPTLLAIG